MCIFVHANSAAAVSIESIFATKCTICILCTFDVQCSQEQNIIDFNKCCSCETTLQFKLKLFFGVATRSMKVSAGRDTGEVCLSPLSYECKPDMDIYHKKTKSEI